MTQQVESGSRDGAAPEHGHHRQQATLARHTLHWTVVIGLAGAIITGFIQTPPKQWAQSLREWSEVLADSLPDWMRRRPADQTQAPATDAPPKADKIEEKPISEPESRRACENAAQAKFGSEIERLVRSLKSETGQTYDYVSGASPKAFALCIDWTLSTPEKRAGTGHGFKALRYSASLRVVESGALDDCVKVQEAAKDARCSCVIVHRNGILADIRFPDGWPAGLCR